jgi:hypothetical protein
MKAIFPVALALALMGAGCDNSAGGGTTTSPTAVTLTTETFTGSVDPLGVAFHPFTVAQQGEVDITLTAAGPPATITMGLGVGVPSGSTCSLTISGGVVQAQASTTPQLVGTAAAGAFCVAVYDIGNQRDTVTYSITVAHP